MFLSPSIISLDRSYYHQNRKTNTKLANLSHTQSLLVLVASAGGLSLLRGAEYHRCLVILTAQHYATITFNKGGELRTPILHELQVIDGEDGELWEGNLNDIIQDLFIKMDAPNFEEETELFDFPETQNQKSGTRDSADRSSAQPGPSRSVQSRHPIITRSQTAADRDTNPQ
ncbi:hypothetical protein V6N11_079530 [Hibiscus sabdariffa]|uniref:Uncharacterized protein n=1 Tax=Hibiscus sabdariffa TaxID=183260 RepID=A0ABR2RVM7_9ROSI